MADAVTHRPSAAVLICLVGGAGAGWSRTSAFVMEQLANPRPDPARIWSAMQNAMGAKRPGALIYRRSGGRYGKGSVVVRAEWSNQNLVLELADGSAGFRIVDQEAFDLSRQALGRWKLGPKTSPEALFDQAFSLASILALLHDPLPPFTQLTGPPSSAEDQGDSWLLSFGAPPGLRGPGYTCVVNKKTSLPVSLARRGEGMPELHIVYQFHPFGGKIPRPPFFGSPQTVSNFGVAFERSGFRKAYEQALARD